MTNWLPYLLLSAVSLTIFNFLNKVVTAKGTSTTIILFLMGLGLSFTSLLILFLTGAKNTAFTRNTIVIALIAGVFWSLGQIFALVMFSRGASLSLGLPLLISILIITGAISGVLFLKEDLSWLKVVGIAVILAGNYLLVKSGS